jgi:hypothetical protein
LACRLLPFLCTAACRLSCVPSWDTRRCPVRLLRRPLPQCDLLIGLRLRFLGAAAAVAECCSRLLRPPPQRCRRDQRTQPSPPSPFSEAPPPLSGCSARLVRPRRCRRCQRGLPSAPSPLFSAVLSRCLSFIYRFLRISHLIASSSASFVPACSSIFSVTRQRTSQAPPSRQRAGVACTSVRAGCVPGRRGEGGSPVDSTPHSPPAVGRTGGTPGAATEGGRYAVEEGDLACGCSCRWCRYNLSQLPKSILRFLCSQIDLVLHLGLLLTNRFGS